MPGFGTEKNKFFRQANSDISTLMKMIVNSEHVKNNKYLHTILQETLDFQVDTVELHLLCQMCTNIRKIHIHKCNLQARYNDVQ